MTSRNDTSSVRAMMTVIALSALSLTTTFNTSGMIYNDSPLAIMGNISDNDMGTTTPSPQMTKTEVQTSYNFAISCSSCLCSCAKTITSCLEEQVLESSFI